MARKVFFSFNYDRDVRRVVQVRNSWRIRPGNESQPFLDKAEWESIKRQGNAAIENWIERQFKGTTVTIVLIGKETYARQWVRHEIKRSHELKKGMLGIYIHNVKDPQTGSDPKGKNPFDYWCLENNGSKKYFSEMYPTYDWVNNDGYNNIEGWIETAARNAGK